MRLSEHQVSTFISVLAPYFAKGSGELRLYGSRADDSRKGGDIDLLLIIENEHLNTALLNDKYKILVEFKKEIGEQKIDFTICLKNKVDSDPFIKVIYPTSILIHEWSSNET